MAYGDYYNPTNKVVNSGDIVYADDINSINAAVDAGFAQVAADLDAVTAGQVAVSQAWANADRGVRPDLALDKYSSKANALEAQDWAVAPGLITEAKTNLPLAGSKSAKVYAAEAASSASSASGFATTATTQAGIATTQAGLATASKDTAVTNAGTATTQAGIATTKATEAQDWASKAVDVIVSAGKYSALHYATKAAESVAGLSPSVVALGALTPAADRIPYYTGASTAALATFTAAGRALLDDVDAAAQRVTLGLGNVPNLDCTNANNITSGTVADARIASTITRDNVVNTATTTALALKAPLSSPTFTGTPSLTNTPIVNDNTTKLASTAFVMGQAGTGSPVMNGTATVGTSFLYSREDHRHPSDTSKANVTSPAFTGAPTAPTAAVSTNTTQLATTAFVINQASSAVPLMDGVASYGSGYSYAREGHIHPTDTSRQASLVSGTNIKTINSNSILGSGDLVLSTGVPLDAGFNNIGSYCLCRSTVHLNPGSTVAGSTLNPGCVDSSGTIQYDTTSLPGTWRLCGYSLASTTNGSRLSNWQRIA